MKTNKVNVAVQDNDLPDDNLTFGDVAIEIGCLFLGAPYQAGTLETSGKEKLVVNFSRFDCLTFVETMLALAECAAIGDLVKTQFRKSLKFLRYREGAMDGYASRLHYFTDWLRDNEKKKVLKDVSRSLGGRAERKKIHFMTTHRELYGALKSENEFQKMLSVEKSLSRKVFYVIGKDKIGAAKSQIQNGDIIAFTTDQEGLDIAHVGFAMWQRGNLYLLHAASTEGAVVVSAKTLAAYLKTNKKFTGIIVARPL